MNVALTRCRKGMVLVTNKCFLQQAGLSTFLGQFCRTWSQHHDTWIDWQAMLSNSVALPGLPGPASSSNNFTRARTVPAPAPISALASQRPPPIHNTKIDEQPCPSPSPRTTAPQRNPLNPKTMTTTRSPPPPPPLTDEMFPALSSAARAGAPKTQQPELLGAWQVQKRGSISRPGPSQAAAHRDSDEPVAHHAGIYYRHRR
jgi:hypothetical protein